MGHEPVEADKTENGEVGKQFFLGQLSWKLIVRLPGITGLTAGGFIWTFSLLSWNIFIIFSLSIGLINFLIENVSGPR